MLQYMSCLDWKLATAILQVGSRTGFPKLGPWNLKWCTFCPFPLALHSSFKKVNAHPLGSRGPSLGNAALGGEECSYSISPITDAKTMGNNTYFVGVLGLYEMMTAGNLSVTVSLGPS